MTRQSPGKPRQRRTGAVQPQSPAADPICESRNGGEIPPSKNVLSCRFWRPIITTRRGVEPRVHRSHSIEAAMNDALRAEADEASTAAADLLAALADGHLAATVRGDAIVGALFFEAPLKGVKSLRTVLGMTQDRPSETRFKPVAAKSRLVGVSDVESAVGCGLRGEHVEMVTGMCAASNTAEGFSALVSVALSCGTNVVRGATYKIIGEDVTCVVDDVVVNPAAPSVWAMTPKSTPEKPTKDEPWMYCLSRGRARAEKMPPFNYGGPLRPYPIMTPRNTLHLRDLPANVPVTDYHLDAEPTSEQESKQQNSTVQYKPGQIDVLRRCCQVARGALDATIRAARPGVTTEELDKICHAYITAHGGYPSPLNYYNFPKSCCTSVNEVICHGVPDARPLESGDILNVDVTAYIYGYHGDLNETVLIGDVDDASKHLCMTAYKCLQKGIETVKPGTRYRDIGEEVTKLATRRNCSVVKSYCGHGIGTLFHCAPNIPHYAKNKAVGAMKEGHVFTIEPMINAGDWRDETWPDGWTAVTRDGQRSAQYEHTMVVTSDGVEILTCRNEDSPKVFPWTEEESKGVVPGS